MDDWTEVDFSALRRMRAPDRPLRVGALETNHDAFNCWRQLPDKPCAKPGAEVEIVKMVLSMLGWNWTMIDLHAEYGIQNEDWGEELPNGTFTGAMGLLQQEKIDLFALTMRITDQRMKAACFSYPLHIFTQTYLVEAPKATDFRYFMYSVMNKDVWLGILGTIFILVFIQTVIYVFEDTCKKSLFEKAGRAAMETLGVFLKQRGSSPRSNTEIVLQAFMLLTMVVMNIYYQSAMNSKLTAPTRPAVPFKTQSELLDILESKEMFLIYPLNNTLDCSSVQNCKRMPEIMQKNPLRVVGETGTPEALKEGGVYFSTSDIDLLPHEVSWNHRKKHVIVIKDPTGLHNYMGYGFSLRNRAYKNAFNKALVRILPGIPRLMTGPGYYKAKNSYYTNVKAIKVRLGLGTHLEQLFETYVVGCAASILVFFIEILWHRSQINRHIAKKCDRKISGRYISAVRAMRWFPSYGRREEAEPGRKESYAAVDSF
ncbi:hypothetical protein QR680_018918 [Steinernema hermaphroditum]|uniref:Ionotropic glutamate receptor C-terminal domain-containing protein n=1 Tax=Steinernema hermaphroditum TaxID=289476 RepID=A0AA39LRU9_9BILA|nr:hypothetical protein QR680_018918 [Steinernema hermaphroditum]